MCLFTISQIAIFFGKTMMKTQILGPILGQTHGPGLVFAAMGMKSSNTWWHHGEILKVSWELLTSLHLYLAILMGNVDQRLDIPMGYPVCGRTNRRMESRNIWELQPPITEIVDVKASAASPSILTEVCADMWSAHHFEGSITGQFHHGFYEALTIWDVQRGTYNRPSSPSWSWKRFCARLES